MKTGSFWLRGALTQTECDNLRDFAATHKNTPGQRISPDTHAQSKHGFAAITSAVSQIAPMMQPVRSVLFSKDTKPKTNWSVPWHQDRIIQVAEKHALAGYKNWSQKDGSWHCEPPQEILNQMLFVRVHLDDTFAENGAMEIVPCSHTLGVIPAASANDIAQNHPTEFCEARAGDIQILHMAILHRSRPSQSTAPRRALRIDYAPQILPHPLQWISQT